MLEKKIQLTPNSIFPRFFIIYRMNPNQDPLPPTLGRGRGRGNCPEQSGTISGSSVSEKFSTTGNGSKRQSSELVEEPNESKKSTQIYSTRPPATIESKEGSSGKIVVLSANYFRLIRCSEFKLTLFRVDFDPPSEQAQVRKLLVSKLKLDGYVYDGANMLYLTKQLNESEFRVTDSMTEQEYTVTIKNTGTEIKDTDAMANQIYNIILRRAMSHLKMQLVGRNLYDAENKVKLDQFRIELWPGFITSIRQHEREVLICTEVSHKVMRQQTIYEILREYRREDEQQWQEKFEKGIIGSIVLTGYNNRTYRIDDVDFHSTPSSVFKQKDTDVTYFDYYHQKYGITILDRRQPMLVSNPKARDIRDGRGTQVIFLVPELCRATGLTDKMKSNFIQMKAMGEHTQMDPMHRKARLLDFVKRLNRQEDSMQCFRRFNTDIGKELVTFEGRALAQETMRFGNGRT